MKKLIYTIPIILLFVFSGYYYSQEQELGKKETKLKTTGDKILFHETYDKVVCSEWGSVATATSTINGCIATTTEKMVKYRYVGNEAPREKFKGKIKVKKDTELLGGTDDLVEIDVNLNEVSRDYNRIDYIYEDTKVSELFLGVQFVKEIATGIWYYLDVATTTETIFNEEVTASTTARMFFPDALKIKEVYATDATFYPDAHTETSSVDGYVGEEISDNRTWATFVGEAGDTVSDSAASAAGTYFVCSIAGQTNKYDALYRSIFVLNTASLPDDATITGATFSLYGFGKADTGSFAPNIDIYSSAPASNTALVAGDYDSLGTTSYTGSPITYSSWSTSGYNAFTFNATGIAAISLTGVTKLGARNANYDVANSAPSWAASAVGYVQFYYSDQSGTDNDPKLVVTYTTGSTAVQPADMLFFE